MAMVNGTDEALRQARDRVAELEDRDRRWPARMGRKVRRWFSRWGNVFDRAALVALVFVVILGFNAIQDSRKEATRNACEERNARNKQASKFLRGLPVEPGAPRRSPRERELLLQGFTDALVGPIEDCEKRVRRVVG